MVAKEDGSRRKTSRTKVSSKGEAESSKQSHNKGVETAPKRQKVQVSKEVPKNWRKSSNFREPLSQNPQHSSLVDAHQELIAMSLFELWQ